MTNEQKNKCGDIIDIAVVAAGATGFSPIPGSDAGPIVAVQTTMILALSEVFDVTFTKSCAINLAKTTIAENVGKYAAGQLIGLIPFGGNLIKGAIAAGITENLGWHVAKDFDRQSKQTA